MMVTMRNVGPLSDAEVVVDGLTVLTGPNGTGKSTVLKALYSILGASQDLDVKAMEDVRRNIRWLMSRYCRDVDASGYGCADDLGCFDPLKERVDEMDALDREVLKRTDGILSGGSRDSFHDWCLKEAIRGEFTSVSQMIGVGNVAEVIVEHRSSVRTLRVKGDDVSWEGTHSDLPHAIYYDTPSAMDGEVDGRFGHRKDLSSILRSGDDGNIIRDILMDDKTRRFDATIGHIVPGRFIRNARCWYDYVGPDGTVLDTANMAEGMKVFSLLRLLMDKGRLDGDTVLLMDEPGMHLHPTWLNVLAETLCILVKGVDVKVVVSTHLPQLLMSLEGVSRRMGIEGSYYHLAREDGCVRALDVSDDPEPAYEGMAEGVDESNRLYWGDADDAPSYDRERHVDPDDDARTDRDRQMSHSQE